MRIRDKVFVVTGGGNGIGQQVVWWLLTRGARVSAVDVSEAGLAQTASRALSVDRLSTHVVNVTDVAAVNALPEAVVAAHGAVDGLLNVAGIIQRFVKFGDLEPADIERVMNVNFYGVVNLCRAFLPLLVARPQAALVNVSSMGGFVPVPGQTIYGAPKAAVKLLTEGLRAELHGTNVAVSVVFPGAVGDQHHGQQRRGDSRDGRCGGAGAQDHPPEEAAEIIVRAVEKGTYRVFIGNDARSLDWLSRLAPERALTLIAQQMAHLLKDR